MTKLILKGKYEYTFEYEGDRHNLSADIISDGDVDVLKLVLEADEPFKPSSLSLSWKMPNTGIHGKWNPGCGFDRTVSDGVAVRSSLYCGAPVGSLYSSDGVNRFTYALSDFVNRVGYSFDNEGNISEWKCCISHFDSDAEPFAVYECIYRFDYRSIRFEDALVDITSLWKEMTGEPDIPDWCRSPICSDELISAVDFISEVESCIPYRIKSVLGNGENLSAIREEADKIHGLGLKYFVDMGAFAPINNSVVEEAISNIEALVKKWDVDGIRIGFSEPLSFTDTLDIGGEECTSFELRADRFLKDLKNRLKVTKPDFAVCLGGRISSPTVWDHSMISSTDCSGDPVSQRVRIIDKRLLGIPAPVSDVIIWNKDDTVTSAVLQFVGTMFGVPRIAVKNSELPEEHRKMLYDWLWFWERNREVLLDGRFHIESAENLYTSASAETENVYIAAKYASNAVIPAPEGRPRLVIAVNGSLNEDIFIRMPKGRGHYNGTIWDCTGRELDRCGASCGETVHVNMPAGARIEFTLS